MYQILACASSWGMLRDNNVVVNMKRRFAWVFASIMAVVVVLAPHAASAFSTQSGDDVTISRTAVHHGSLYVAGQNVTVNAKVEGDVFCGGNLITINGEVTGDVICAGQNLTINGKVHGNIRAAGQNVTINGEVGRNVSVAGQNITLAQSARVGGELAMLTQSAQINGPVVSDVYGAATALNLDSTVGGSVTVESESVVLASAAHIAGDFNYTSQKTFQLASDQVGGHVNRHESPRHPVQSPRDLALVWIFDRLYWIAASLVAALALVWLAPRFLRYTTDTMTRRPGASIGWGALLLIAGPIVLVIVAITFIGMPLAFMGGLVWLLGLCLSGLLVSVAAGRRLLARTNGSKASLPLAVLVGVPITFIAFGIPVLGPLAGLVATCWALGGLALSLRATRS